MVQWQGRYHFMAVGGMGMSALAKILAQRGISVSGCDVQPHFMTKADLSACGVTLFTGHDPKHLQDADFVVYSSAIKPDNEEFRAALDEHIPVLHRSEILADLLDEGLSVAVTGTHGKSSTTGFIAQGLELLGFDPTFIGGAVVNPLGGNAKLGSGPVIGEVDESDGSLVRIPASVKVVLNLDDDHLPFYGTMENLAATVHRFILGRPHNSIAVLNYNDPLLRGMDYSSRRVHWCGFGSPDIRIDALELEGVNPKISVCYEGKQFTILNDKIFGKHNGLNLAMAFSVLVAMGINPNSAAKVLEEVQTPRRRQQILGSVNGTSVMVDIALHPTELKALREVFESSKRRVLLIFQPHRYSRYKLLFKEFVEELSLWSDVVITEIYPSDEPVEDTSSYPLYEEIGSRNKFFYSDKEKLFQDLPNIMNGYDIVLFAGLGSIGNWAEEFYTENSTKK